MKSLALSAFVLCLFATTNSSTAVAQYGGGNRGGQGHHQSNYHSGHNRNHGYNNHGGYGYGNYGRYGYGYQPYSSNYNYGYYQRPYPYHLDYYRMRYQGSYEPYAGNLYGPPLIQQYVAPPYAAPQVISPSFLPSPYYPTPIRNYAGAYYW